MNQNNYTELLILSTTIVVMLGGLAFTVIPPVPGTVLIWGAAAFYWLAQGTENFDWLAFGLMTILMVIGVVIDIVAGHFGAKLGGASWMGVAVGMVVGLLLAIVASFIGTPLLGCLAGAIGMTIGVVAVEWQYNRDWKKVRGALQGYCAGSVAGIVAKLGTGVLMFIIFLMRVL